MEVYLWLGLIGVLTHQVMFGVLHSGHRRLDNRGEAGDGGTGEGASANSGSETPANTFTQEDVNNIVAREVKKIQEKFGDYGELAKYKTEQEQLAKQREEKDLESRQEYEKLKTTWSQTENQYKQQLLEKDTALNNEKINNALVNEAYKQNAFPDTAKLVRELAQLNADGKVVIKGKNEVGVETDLSVEEGLKQFLKERPYLVKDSSQGGSGTPPQGAQGGEGNANSNSGDLADQMINARSRGDQKEVKRIKEMIRAKHNTGAILH